MVDKVKERLTKVASSLGTGSAAPSTDLSRYSHRYRLNNGRTARSGRHQFAAVTACQRGASAHRNAALNRTCLLRLHRAVRVLTGEFKLPQRSRHRYVKTSPWQGRRRRASAASLLRCQGRAVDRNDGIQLDVPVPRTATLQRHGVPRAPLHRKPCSTTPTRLLTLGRREAPAVNGEGKLRRGGVPTGAPRV